MEYDLDIYQICFQAITKVKSDWPSSTFTNYWMDTKNCVCCAYIDIVVIIVWINRFYVFKSIAKFNMCHPNTSGIVKFGCEQMALVSMQMSNIKWYDEHGAVCNSFFSNYNNDNLAEVEK